MRDQIKRAECESWGVNACWACTRYGQQTKNWGTCFAPPVTVDIFKRAWQHKDSGSNCPQRRPGPSHVLTGPVKWEVWLIDGPAQRSILSHKDKTSWRFETALKYARGVAADWAEARGVQRIELVPDSTFDAAEVVRVVVWARDAKPKPASQPGKTSG